MNKRIMSNYSDSILFRKFDQIMYRSDLVLGVLFKDSISCQDYTDRW